MSIGVSIGRNLGPTLSQKLVEPGVTQLTWTSAVGVVPRIQGSNFAVAPVGETSSNLLTPVGPGGLQMQKLVIVVVAQPIAVNPATVS
jgi:hypothetical protein